MLTTTFVAVYLTTHQDWQLFTDGNPWVSAPIYLERTDKIDFEANCLEDLPLNTAKLSPP